MGPEWASAVCGMCVGLSSLRAPGKRHYPWSPAGSKTVVIEGAQQALSVSAVMTRVGARPQSGILVLRCRALAATCRRSSARAAPTGHKDPTLLPLQPACLAPARSQGAQAHCTAKPCSTYTARCSLPDILAVLSGCVSLPQAWPSPRPSTRAAACRSRARPSGPQ
jgi:hypothetical protein